MAEYTTCRTCGHESSEHTGMSGPNSIGQWFFGECVHGSTKVPPYRFGGCGCRKFVPQRFRVVRAFWRGIVRGTRAAFGGDAR